VTVKGREGDEKVIVTIERRVGNVAEQETAEETWDRIWKENEDNAGESSVIENRDLIFMRLKTSAQIEADKAQFGKPSRAVKRENILPAIEYDVEFANDFGAMKLPPTLRSAMPSYLLKRYYSDSRR
jgi:hypothetical protein